MELKVPNLGENISESNIIAIHLEKGKEIQKDDIILELETDKATLEIPSPDCGIVKEILVKVGDSIKQGQVVAILEESTQKELVSLKPKVPKRTIRQGTIRETRNFQKPLSNKRNQNQNPPKLIKQKLNLLEQKRQQANKLVSNNL